MARVVWFFDELFVPHTIDLGRLKVIPSQAANAEIATPLKRNSETRRPRPLVPRRDRRGNGKEVRRGTTITCGG